MKIRLNPQFLYDEEGHKTRVVLRFADFEKIMDQLEDLKSLYTVHVRLKSKKKLIPFEVIKKELKGNESKKLS